VFRRHDPPSWKKILKNYLEGQHDELCDVIGWVAPKLQERNLLRAAVCVMLAKNMSF
jgi:hypothetical protein